MEAGARRHWTDDTVLADEIELYGELVVAASESERELTLPQIDRVLGVDQPDDGGAPRKETDGDEGDTRTQ
ncbi:MAG: hypothetical protein ACLGIA_00260 [Actinomycetes bacterium]